MIAAQVFELFAFVAPSDPTARTAQYSCARSVQCLALYCTLHSAGRRSPPRTLSRSRARATARPVGTRLAYRQLRQLTSSFREASNSCRLEFDIRIRSDG